MARLVCIFFAHNIGVKGIDIYDRNFKTGIPEHDISVFA